jgi:hypothetical protein
MSTPEHRRPHATRGLNLCRFGAVSVIRLKEGLNDTGPDKAFRRQNGAILLKKSALAAIASPSLCT